MPWLLLTLMLLAFFGAAFRMRWQRMISTRLERRHGAFAGLDTVTGRDSIFAFSGRHRDLADSFLSRMVLGYRAASLVMLLAVLGFLAVMTFGGQTPR